MLLSSSSFDKTVQLVNKTITLKILLVEFQDVKHRSPEYPANLALPAYTYSDFEIMFFSENEYFSPNMYSPDGKEVFGSLRDYFRIMSNDNLDINGYVLNNDANNDRIPDWITLDRSKSYYHNNRGNAFREESKCKANSEGLNIETNCNTFLVIIYAGHTYRAWGNNLNPSAHYDKHDYIMGERFASCFPYEEERDDPSIYRVSHFAHIGIHAHEFSHLLGCYDLKGVYLNYDLDLMSSGNFNGPYDEGACPAALNPYFRFKLGWQTINKIQKSSTEKLKYNLISPKIYCIEDLVTKDIILVEYRKFNSKIKIGDCLYDDYNSYINKMSMKEGILVWKVLKGGFIKLLHSCGNNCNDPNHHIFPGEKNIKVLTPWSDSRYKLYGNFWIPNTKPSNNIGLEIKSIGADDSDVEFYLEDPFHTSPSNPKNIIIKSDQNIRMEWTKNSEPDLSYYKIYKKGIDDEYYIYDSTVNNNYIDITEIPNSTNDTTNYVYYKITSFDSEKKESTFSAEVKVSVSPRAPTKIVGSNVNNNNFILEQNYPNPFNPSTTIKYFLPEASKVKLAVYDVLGNQIKILVNKIQNAGNYEVDFNITDKNNLSSGVYLFRMSAANFVDIKKGIVLK